MNWMMNVNRGGFDCGWSERSEADGDRRDGHGGGGEEAEEGREGGHNFSWTSERTWKERRKERGKERREERRKERREKGRS